MGPFVLRNDLIARIRQACFSFKRQGRNDDLFRKKGTTLVVSVPRRDRIEPGWACVKLREAGLTEEEIKIFLDDHTKT